METFTLTFGDRAENHAGMEIIGNMAKKGFNIEDLISAKAFFETKGIRTEIYHLNKLLGDKKYKAADAYVLIARKGVEVLLGKGGADKLYKEQSNLEKDTKAYMYGRVVDKKARYNLCFDEKSRKPDYKAGKGRIIGYDEVPVTFELKKSMKKVLGRVKTEDLVIEGNYYYDVNKCYIGFHGDSERRKVIGVRMGKSFKLHYQWYGIPEIDEKATKKAKEKNKNARARKVKPLIGKRLELVLNHGDLYIMSENAVGTDWKAQNKLTLRHAAGEPCNLKGINKNVIDVSECLFDGFDNDLKVAEDSPLENIIREWLENESDGLSEVIRKELKLKNNKKVKKAIIDYFK